ncbi:peptidase S45 [Proteobacteria bacterium 005FR1]|nr:peptidase S45 [Proteobacteria bacterium 005FR1]
MKSLYRLSVPLLAASLIACTSSQTGRDAPEFSAEIQRTEFGIPHIVADDYKGLGYGLGYSFAQDNICSLAREIVIASGKSALYLEESEDNIERDIFFTWYNTEERQRALLDKQPPDVRDAVAGYAAGYSRYLRDAGIDNIDPACAGQPWVREITELDLAAVYTKGSLRGGLANFIRQIVRAQPPGASVAGFTAIEAGINMDVINALEGGSNAYALGAEVTENGSGMLYGNPHEPWGEVAGVQRFYQFHLTLPGELDVMGVAQQGQPFVNIGFNKDIAWTHTVSTAKRFSLYQLRLAGDDPLTYVYENLDGEAERKPIQRHDVSIALPGGRTKTGQIYTSHYGPMLAVNLLNEELPSWGTHGLAFAIRDAASENTRSLAQWLAIGKAIGVEDLAASLKEILGLGFINTIAADRHGAAMYADISTVPHVTAERLSACIGDHQVLQGLAKTGIPALDGSTAACEWGSDADSPQPGIFGGANLPVQIRRDYLLNSNDSYWLSNLEHPVTGYSPMLRRQLLARPDTVDADAHPRLLRTRMAFMQIEDRLSGADGLGGTRFSMDNLKQLVYGNRSYAAEVELDAVLADCFANPRLPVTGGGTIDGTEACEVLSRWDRRNNLESRGAHVFRAFWERVPFRQQLATIYQVPFDQKDPVFTPRGIIIDDSIRQALGDAIKLFQDAGVPLDAELGQVQYVFDRSAEPPARIPMHGGLGREGVFNVAETIGTNGDGHYAPITKGPTYMQVVSFDERGPIADALLGYSNSGDPTRPFNRDQTRRYSAKEWIRLPFHADQIREQAIGKKVRINE